MKHKLIEAPCQRSAEIIASALAQQFSKNSLVLFDGNFSKSILDTIPNVIDVFIIKVNPSNGNSQTSTTHRTEQDDDQQAGLGNQEAV